MKPRHFVFGVWAVAAVLGLTAAAGIAAGYRVNLTGSAPKGLWRVSTIGQENVRRGDLVSICPPALLIVMAMRDKGDLPPGSCPGASTAPLLKPVAAIPGDSVSITGEGVSVNGRALPNSAPATGMPSYPAGTYKVAPGHVWLISSYSRGSFDSRYYGPAPLDQLRGLASPVLIHGDPARMTI